MIIQGPSPVVPIPSLSQVTDASLRIDLNAGTFLIVYAAGAKSVSGTLAPATLTALKQHVRAQIELNEGWAPGSSVLTP